MHLNKRESVTTLHPNLQRLTLVDSAPANFSTLVDRTRKDGPRGIKLYVWAQRLGEDRISK